MSKRKTIDVDHLREYANGFLAANGGDVNRRMGVIAMIEHALMSSGNYNGFRYLEQRELKASDLPGIRWLEDDCGMPFADFQNTDASRRCYS